mgnify:CR=1 FL=1
MRKSKFPEMQVGMRIKVQNNNKWYEGKIVKEIHDTPYKFLFVSNSPFRDGWDCDGLAPRKRGYKLEGFGETDMVWAEPSLFNRLE